MDHNITQVLMPIAIFGGLGGSVYFFTKVMTDYVLKKKMIEKGYVNDDTQAIFKQHQTEESKYPSLKWGLLCLFGGIALILMEYFPTSPESPLPYGLIAVSLSLGFLLYFFIVKKQTDK